MPISIPPEIQASIAQAIDWLWINYGKQTFEKSTDFQIAVCQKLEKHFDLSELRDLCFQLKIDFENLNGENKRDKAREIVLYCQRHELIEKLKDKVTDLRPNIDWSEVEQQLLQQLLNDDDSYTTKWRKGIEKYYTSLYERVGFVRILGRMEAEPLEDIFTHVNVLDKVTAEQRYDIQKLITEFNPRDFRRWDRVWRVSGDKIVGKSPKLFILGKPGAGKTTFLKHTALRAIKHEIKKVPLFVTLKELSDSGMGIMAFMSYQLGLHRFPKPAAFLAQLLERGDALVLFDGLDEVNLADDKRATMIQRLNEFIYRFGECPILMTCRVAATDYSFTQFKYVEVADFDVRQIAAYIDLWFVDDEIKRKNFNQVLLEDENYKPVRELAQVPLLLALLCLVYEERNEIPPERHEIYEEAMRALLSKWDASRNINRDVIYQHLSLRRKVKMLTIIAARTFEKGEYFLKEKDVVHLIEEYLRGVPGLEEPEAERVLKALEAQHGIFVERAMGIHSFSHLTLQEYFTARYIVDNERRGTVSWLMQHAGDNRWREVFFLVAGMLDDATEFGEQFMMASHRLLEDSERMSQLLDWRAQRGAATQSGYKPAASRAFLHFRGDNLADDIDLARNVVDHVPVFSPDHKRIRISALELALAFDFDLDLDVALALAFDRVRDRNRDIVRDIDLTLALEHSIKMAERRKLVTMAASLQDLEIPHNRAKPKAWHDFAKRLEDILGQYQEHWSPFSLLDVPEGEHFSWKDLSEDQITSWGRYLEANLLLVRCLQVAYVPNRQALEDKILLPPDMW